LGLKEVEDKICEVKKKLADIKKNGAVKT